MVRAERQTVVLREETPLVQRTMRDKGKEDGK